MADSRTEDYREKETEGEGEGGSEGTQAIMTYILLNLSISCNETRKPVQRKLH